MTRFASVTLAGLLCAVVGCGGGAAAGGKLSPKDASGMKDRSGREVSKEAVASFDAALTSFLDHDKKGDWDEGSCKSVADDFEKASDHQEDATGKHLPEAVYNAGLAYQRCGKDTEARTKFEDAIKADSAFHRARAQITLYDYAKGSDMDDTIRKLDQIIRDAKFQNVEALVSLAALQMERGSDQADGDGKNDMERAQRNLQRALAIDDSYMPAFNQLSVYYLEQAKNQAGAGRQRSRKGKRGMEVSGSKKADVNEQQLDLAALVASQAQRKNPNYAPIHNTTGLIQVELKNFNAAVKSFGKARQLDPKFFEAQMNYAAVNLSFRGFEEAEKAYREALKLRPKEYEAHLGLALALRGQINDSNFDKYVGEAQKSLDEAKKLDGGRPETFYNEAILTHEYRSKRAGNNPVPMLEKAAGQYRDFVNRAGDDPVFAEAVKRSKDRTTDIEDTIKFIKEGEEAKKADEAAQKAAKEQAERDAKDKAAADKAAKEQADKEAKDKAAADKAAADKAAKPADPKAGGAGAKPADPKAAPAAPAGGAKKK